jgi:lysophospholipase L1-like esterase
MSDFVRYIALGDSTSMDLYPALDAGEIDVAVALERVPTAGRVAPLGAASLLYENDEARFPDDVGNDLSSLYPGIDYKNLATDAATIGEVFGEQLAQLEESDEPLLITLTIGSNDLLSAFGNRPKRALLERITADVREAYDFLIDTLRGRFPNGTLIVTTVSDPSDKTGKIPGVFDDRGVLPIDVLDTFNDFVRTLASGTPNVLLADAAEHFLGHGVTAADDERWYWRRSLVELNVMGANELRRLWLRSLGEGV